MTFELGTDGPHVIVVGVDGSPTSLRAAAYAGGLARRQGAKLVVVYVRSVSAMASLAVSTVGAVRETLDELTQELRSQMLDGAQRFGVDAEFVTTTGDAYSALVKAADQYRADAVVVGASMRPDHRLAGSIAVRLVRAKRWPVTVVP
jgi:nucleotide-binding universal stress UspA family protein